MLLGCSEVDLLFLATVWARSHLLVFRIQSSSFSFLLFLVFLVKTSEPEDNHSVVVGGLLLQSLGKSDENAGNRFEAILMKSWM